MRRIKASPAAVICHYLVLTAVSVVVLIPIVWALITSLKPESLVVTRPPRWIPRGGNLPELLPRHLSRRASGDTFSSTAVIVAASTVFLCLVAACHCSYASVRSHSRAGTHYSLASWPAG